MKFFKFIRAEEELARVHVEVKRLLTSMVDEEEMVSTKVKEVEQNDPALALQLTLYWKERARYNTLHRSRLFAITRLKGFDQANRHYWTIGTHVSRQPRARAAEPVPEDMPRRPMEDDDSADEDDADEFRTSVTTVLDIAFDND